MESIDINLYSRQIKAYGIETMKDLSKLTILIIGIRGLGLEVAKNLILSGPKEVNIYDPHKCTISDLGTNYYINEKDVIEGKRRDIASLSNLCQLNSYVTLSIMEGDDIFKNLKKYNVIVISEIMDENTLIKLDEDCRNNNIGFIYSCSFGISGFIFSDFGKNFFIKDPNGVEKKSYIIKNVTNEKQGLITIDDESSIYNEFDLFFDDMVIISDIKGMEELNDKNPKEFIKKDKNSFYIKEDTTNYGKYIKGGVAKQFKKPIDITYKSLKERMVIPYEDETYINPIDSKKKNINPILHCGFMGVQKYFTKYRKLPELNDLNECKLIIEYAKEIYEKSKKNNEEWIEDMNEFNEKIVENIARWSKAEIAPMCSIMGGIISQEVIKFTGKYTPINQWMWFDFFETVSLLNENIERKLEGTRYDDLISIYGNEIQKKLENLNIFMIGAGANGCEFLKNFALMGISSSKGQMVVTDNDIIEVSNLNRQFLFQKNNIGDYKSKIACEKAKIFNPNLNIKDYQLTVQKETENIFDDKFWNEQDLIIFAVDNDEGRDYIDTQCTNNKLVGIDAGTSGTKGRVTLIVPDITSSLRERNKIPQKVEIFPMCTLHHFPNTIIHCIEYAKIKFLELTNEGINNMKKYIKQEETDLTEENNKFSKEEKQLIYDYINLIISKDVEELLKFCIILFVKYFDTDIQKILELFPKNSLQKNGNLFWSGSKRVPHPIKYDINNELCFTFIKNNIIIFSHLFGIQIIESKIDDMIKNIDANRMYVEQKNYDSKDILLKNMKINNDIKAKINLIKPLEFNKENDLQIFLIHSFANLRANNFDIENSSYIETKLILGKIIPSIPTSTATVGGFVTLQILNLIQTHNLNILRNTLFNLGISLITQLKPQEVKYHIDNEIEPIINESVRNIPNKWTIWDRIDINGSKTCKEFIEFIKNEYNVIIKFINSDNIIIYDSLSKKSKLNIDMKIEDIYKLKSKSKLDKILWINIIGKLDNKRVFMPKFKYKYK